MARSEAQKRAERNYEKKREVRGQNWMIILYPDSMPDDWRDVLNELHIPILVSPLHDGDVNADKTQKKPHYHVLLMFESMKSLSQIREISDRLNAPVPMKQDSKRGAARYLCHLDNPDKAQYPIDSVVEMGGADYLGEVNSGGDKYRIIGEIIDYCDAHKVYSYAKLMRVSREENQEWYRALCDNIGWAVKEFCKSSRYDIEERSRIARADLSASRRQCREEMRAIEDISPDEDGNYHV